MYDVNEYLDESNPIMSEGEESSTEGTKVEASSEDGQAEEQPNELSLEDQLEGVEIEQAEKEEGAPDVLSLVNELGLIRNGLPYEYENLEDIKEHLMKGHDYTSKTQELAELRKQTETELSQEREQVAAERAEFETERQQVESSLVENEILAEIMGTLQTQEPEVFAEIQREFQQRMGMHNKALNNPEVNKLKSELSEIKKSLGEKGEQDQNAKHEEIRAAWDNGLKEVQTGYAMKLKTLGVKPDWAKVQSIWQADATGEMTVKQAMLAVHGEDIQKGLEAKAKLAATKAKSAQRQGPSGVSGQGEKQVQTDSYLAAAERLLKEHS